MITVVTNECDAEDIDYDNTDSVMLVVCRNSTYETLKNDIMRRCAEHFVPFYLMFTIPETNKITKEFLHGFGTTIDAETTCVLPPEQTASGETNQTCIGESSDASL